jgi:Endonuclease NucS
MEEIKLWRITGDGNGKPRAVPVDSIAETSTEELLEDVLTGSPDLLMTGLHLIARQSETPGGPLDLLGVDQDGQLVIFELKRGKLTRDAVAQAIDYGSYLAGLEPDHLCHHVNENSGKGGTEAIRDFAQWYQSQFQRPVSDIGRPRIVLVGLAADERTKRMVEFLAQSELDVSLITFHGFTEAHGTLLARQVEVQSQVPVGQVKSTKLANQAKLDKLLTALGIRENYESMVNALKHGLSDFAYQWPNPAGYSFYFPEVADSGGPTNRAYIALYAPESRNGKIQILLQARAISAAGEDTLKSLASNLESTFVSKSGGTGEIWIDGHNSATLHKESLVTLGQTIVLGWKRKMEDEAKAEAAEVTANPEGVPAHQHQAD